MTSIFKGNVVAHYLANLGGEEFKPYIEEMGFYNNGCVVALRRSDAEVKFVAAGDGDLEDRQWVMLEGSPEDIATANDMAGLELTESNVIEYLCFYGKMLRPVVYVTDGDDGHKDSGPAHVKEARADGSYICEATISHDWSLFRAVFEITEHGYVEVIEEEALGAIPRVH